MSLSDITDKITFISYSKICIDSSLLICTQCRRLLLYLSIIFILKLINCKPRRGVWITHNPYVLVSAARSVINVTWISRTATKNDWRLLSMVSNVVVRQLLLWAVHFLYKTLDLVSLHRRLLAVKSAALMNESVTRGLLRKLYDSSFIGIVQTNWNFLLRSYVVFIGVIPLFWCFLFCERLCKLWKVLLGHDLLRRSARWLWSLVWLNSILLSSEIEDCIVASLWYILFTTFIVVAALEFETWFFLYSQLSTFRYRSFAEAALAGCCYSCILNPIVGGTIESLRRSLLQHLVVHANLPRGWHGALGLEVLSKVARLFVLVRPVFSLPIELWYFKVFIFNGGHLCVATIDVTILMRDISNYCLEALCRVLHVLDLRLCHSVMSLMSLFKLATCWTEQVGYSLVIINLKIIWFWIFVRTIFRLWNIDRNRFHLWWFLTHRIVM